MPSINTYYISRVPQCGWSYNRCLHQYIVTIIYQFTGARGSTYHSGCRVRQATALTQHLRQNVEVFVGAALRPSPTRRRISFGRRYRCRSGGRGGRGRRRCGETWAPPG
jgi:hypothetical protein